jgi:hypothetical protein
MVVDLAATDAGRLPVRDAGQTTLEGVVLPRLAVAAGQAALPLLLAFLGTLPGTPPAAN